MRLKCLALALAASSWAVPGAAFADSPAVVASIKPVYSLVAGVMAGVGKPALIVHGAASPHTYSLRPSDARALDAAQLVFWVGPSMESFLAKPLQALAGRAEIVEIDRAPGINTLPARIGGVWERDLDVPVPAGSGTVDGHLWLDIDNAKAIVHLAAERLSARTPAISSLDLARSTRNCAPIFCPSPANLLSFFTTLINISNAITRSPRWAQFRSIPTVSLVPGESRKSAPRSRPLARFASSASRNSRPPC